MASNFHSIGGWLIAGLDYHIGIHYPIPPEPLPIPETPFFEIVAAHPFVMGPNQKPTVKLNGVSAVVLGHTPLLLGPHLPVIPDMLNMIFLLDFLLGSHTCWMPRSTVLICDSPAAVCALGGGASINNDCSDWPVSFTSVIFQPGNVQTTPTLADLAMGLALVAAGAAVDKLGEKVGERFGAKLAQTAFGKSVRGLENKLQNKVGTRIVGKDLMNAARARLGSKAGKKAFNQTINRAGKQIAQKLGKTLSPHALVTHGLQTAGFPDKPITSTFGLAEGIPGSKFALGEQPKSVARVLDPLLPVYGAGHGLVQAIGG